MGGLGLQVSLCLSPPGKAVTGDLRRASETTGTEVADVRAGADQRDTISLRAEAVARMFAGVLGSCRETRIDWLRELDFNQRTNSIGGR